MAIKKTSKKSSKRIGDPHRRPKAKPVARKKAPPKPVQPKAGDYFEAIIDGTHTKGIVRKDEGRKCLILCCKNDNDLYFDENQLGENMGFYGGIRLLPGKDILKGAEPVTLYDAGLDISSYTVITDAAGKEKIDAERIFTVLGHEVSPDHINGSFSFGCGSVNLPRTALEAFVQASRKLPAQFIDNLLEALQALTREGYTFSDVDVTEVETILKRYPLLEAKGKGKSKAKPKKRKR